MATGPKWKRVLISGSNLEVNHLTSSTALEPFRTAGIARSLVFTSETGGHFQVTSSINNKHQTGDTSPNLFLLSESVNVPNLPISASTVANPISNPSATPPLINFPVVFKDATHGGFEVTSSIAFEPFLGFFASQSTDITHQMRSGSKVEGPDPGATAPFPPIQSPAPSSVEYALTFTGSFFHTDDAKSFVKASNGDAMEFKRAIPAGQGITASFSLPVLVLPQGSSYNPPGDKFKIVLRHYLAESILNSTGEFTEQEYEISILDPTIAPSGNPQNGEVGSTFNTAITGSATGSFVVNGPIQVGDRFQLRYRRTTGTNIFHVGYRPNGTGNISTPLKFQFSGSSVTPSDSLSGIFSGSFQGNIANNVSSSLTGITLAGVANITRGKGVLFRTGNSSATLYDGTAPVTASIRLHEMNTGGQSSPSGVNKSGLEVPELGDTLFTGFIENDSNTTLELADGVPQAGLEFDGNKTRISVDLASNSGLNFDGNGDLKVADTFPGVALSGSFGGALGGAVDINLNPSQSGLQILTAGPGSGLGLKPEVAGQGLNSDSVVVLNELSVDTNFAVTGSGSMTLRAVGAPYSLQVAKNLGLGAPFESEGNSQTISYNDNFPDANGALILRTTQPKAITFKNNLIISGNFRVLDSSNVTSINTPDFRTTDPFILLNSGSDSTSPFNNSLGGILVQTSSFAQGVASGSAVFANFKALGDTIGNGAFLKTGWAVSKGNIPFDATSPVPPFNSTTELTNKIRTSDFIANLSHLRLSGIGSEGNPESGDLPDTHYGTTTSVDTLGSWYVDTGSTATSLGGESNVYLYGIFD